MQFVPVNIHHTVDPLVLYRENGDFSTERFPVVQTGREADGRLGDVEVARLQNVDVRTAVVHVVLTVRVHVIVARVGRDGVRLLQPTLRLVEATVWVELTARVVGAGRPVRNVQVVLTRVVLLRPEHGVVEDAVGRHVPAAAGAGGLHGAAACLRPGVRVPVRVRMCVRRRVRAEILGVQKRLLRRNLIVDHTVVSGFSFPATANKIIGIRSVCIIRVCEEILPIRSVL